MKVQLKPGQLEDLSHDANVLFVATKVSRNKKTSKDETTLSAHGGSPSLVEAVKGLYEEKLITGKANEAFFLRNYGAEKGQHLLVIGLGPSHAATFETLRRAAAAAFKALRSHKVASAGFSINSLTGLFKDQEKIAQALTEGLLLAGYKFDELKSAPKDEKSFPEEVHFVIENKSQARTLEKGIEIGTIIAEATNFSRYLGDLPGNILTPSELANQAVKGAKGAGLKVTVWDKAKIKKEKMGCFFGVSLGSTQDPRLIVMEYKGAAASKAPICYVGKGLTFDSGGISIKPAAQMEEMKFDMCGGATVIGTMIAIAKLGLKVNAIGIVPASENMPGPGANKPGDICTARNGKTVEVNNTDAEGRLILSDALVYASEQKPAWICDIATLTGAMKMALGDTHTGFFSRDPALTKKIEAAAQESGEAVWEMPMTEDHLKDMKGNYADLSNISGPSTGAGSAKGAVFLGEFVDKAIPWAHFDIAGTAWHTANRINYCPDRGATGVMLRTFIELARAHK